MTRPVRPTPSVLKALRVVADNPGIRPREFAKAMWPDSPGWERSARSGPNGSHQGGGMYPAGGAFLGRLALAGLTRRTHSHEYDTGHAITPAGQAMLDAAR